MKAMALSVLPSDFSRFSMLGVCTRVSAYLHNFDYLNEQCRIALNEQCRPALDDNKRYEAKAFVVKLWTDIELFTFCKSPSSVIIRLLFISDCRKS